MEGRLTQNLPLCPKPCFWKGGAAWNLKEVRSLTLITMKRRFFVAQDEEIRRGKTTDIYFERTRQILEHLDDHTRVYAEFTASSLPDGYEWAVFVGLEESLRLLEGLPVDVYALPEGTVFRNRDHTGVPVPVMAIEGEYRTFAVYETPILGFLCQSSGIATRAARIKRLAGDIPVLSFGIRRMHPALAPVIDRSAYIGGCDGVSSILGAETIGRNPQGTMPHALIIVLGEREAWKAFDRLMPPEVPRIALIDTYGDEKQKAIEAAETIPNLKAVRLDTPGSRRGDFARIVREVRWELDIRGYSHVDVFVSGGLSERNIRRLKEAGARGFGVGTSISNAPTIDFAMDIVAIGEKPVAKKGKFGGRKQVFRCPRCLTYRVTPSGQVPNGPPVCPQCGTSMEPVLQQVMAQGRRLVPERPVEEIRNEVLRQIFLLPEPEVA